MIQFHYSCGGCNATAISGHVRLRFQSISGRTYGFGHYTLDADPERDAPAGWVAFDHIGCTYCPSCWAEIEAAINAPHNEPPA